MSSLLISELFGPTIARALPDRILARVAREADGCWRWTGALNGAGYGQTWLDGRQVSTHRVLFAAAHGLLGTIGTMPSLDHLCRNRACCNPAHLEPVSARTNTLRSPIAPAAINARKVECVHGHPLTDCYIRPDGRRRCRTCEQDRSRAYQRARRKEVMPL